MRPATISENKAMADLDAASGGRLGAFVLDTASGRMTGHRADELFGMCSTFKLSLCAALFQLAEQGELSLDELLPYSKADLLPVSPVTTENLPKGGMTVEALAKATQLTSDNAAANILMRRIGGAGAVTAFWRSLGDGVSRLDRYETELNLVPPGELRDTTSPRAMAHSMAKFLTTDVLSIMYREKLIGWMADTATGTKRIRGGLPQSWRQGDKTGTAIHTSFANKYNDVAIFWPPARPPVIVACFYEGPGHFESIRDEDQAVLAEVGRIAAVEAVEWHGGLD
jgi:beta-lactamase class A